MGLIELASRNSVWRGMDYFEAKKVIAWSKTGDNTFDGTVSGSDNNVYYVHLDKEHPRKSTCTCPYADGRRVICKHMMALYFTAEPQAAEDLLKQAEEWEREEEEREQQHYEDIHRYVYSLSKAELREKLYYALLELEDTRDIYW